MRVGSLALLFISCALPLHFPAQTPNPPTFEVASLRLDPDNDTRMTSISPHDHGRFTAQRVSLPLLMQIAFKVDAYQIEQKLPWADTTTYDITASTDTEAPLTDDQFRLMLQHLLEQRLHLVAHRETRPTKAYVLTVAKGGSKLTPSTKPAGMPYILPDGIRGDHLSAETLAHLLTRPAGRPVFNRTDLEGYFDVHLHYAPLNDTDSSLPSVFAAVKEQLGLQLETAQVPVETIVIDKADKVPTEN